MCLELLGFGGTNLHTEKALADSKESPVIFFGDGLFFTSFDETLTERGIAFAVTDNDSKKWGRLLSDGNLVISPQEMVKKYKNSYISIAINDLQFYDEIYRQILEMGFCAYKLLSFTEIVVNVEKKRLKNVFDFLCDEESRRVLQAFYTFDFRERIENLKKLNCGEPYFCADVINLGENETFIDAGAFIGDTVAAFIRYTGNKFKVIHSFEPSKENTYRFLAEYSDDNRIKHHQTALGSKNARDSFYENGSGGQIRKGSSEIVQVERLDDVLNGEEATFIKMDIEGSELDALFGAEKTILRYKPKLAICVYHKAIDICNISFHIKQLVPDYKLYLRHHSNSQYETVLYAVAE